ncbi:uncharacterized protein L969DRAFT_92245 [Mixia osmundae IAM 14324]|uniref:Acyl-protein thioesterase 1 n=1 Tax=Mixia osmundae (strain CBS 9802 / IAM 14324 / JCM 22182 / KY 12970) TaxID=764103 RepID=G7DTJ3_MIXOS|nr:uncharacterized protein L969DRAFT_92245 [Mixia osmundae IAM 14324]KEI42823.1 hypothetical protein L969DRAFT_92245 [Mixia osmundae IAM 14324]GAA93840.1 hypothetical protein E5Q_00486 [Mixia osmundae IAM 14324]
MSAPAATAMTEYFDDDEPTLVSSPLRSKSPLLSSPEKGRDLEEGLTVHADIQHKPGSCSAKSIYVVLGVLVGLVIGLLLAQIRVSARPSLQVAADQLRNISFAADKIPTGSDGTLQADTALWQYVARVFDSRIHTAVKLAQAIELDPWTEWENYEQPVVLDPTVQHTATVILLHGLTGTGWNMQRLAQPMRERLPHVKWIMPHAPVVPVTLKKGEMGHSWFDISAAGEAAGEYPTDEDEAGMLSSVSYIIALVANETWTSLPSNRIVLAGFSQGAILALLAGAMHDEPLGGVAVLSGYLPLRAKMFALASSVVRTLPIWWGHGKSDQVVLFNWAVKSLDYLRKALHMTRVRLHAYDDLGHGVGEGEKAALLDWLAIVLPDSSIDQSHTP